MIIYLSLFLLNLINILQFYTLAIPLPAPPVFEKIPHYPAKCYLPPESGLCLNNDDSVKFKISNDKNEIDQLEENRLLLHRFFFDSVTRQCYEFGAQECGGNENRFKTAKECMEICALS
uniref:BPTI/Kunitz inhibitor domain-containing protein n=1 Tax=Meloidogyne enterolobii TaxID=390850 RepID=A0A6V7TSQ6_MELEN|nr:unnamed protein product [Meloidogyne enterolobii]